MKSSNKSSLANPSIRRSSRQPSSNPKPMEDAFVSTKQKAKYSTTKNKSVCGSPKSSKNGLKIISKPSPVRNNVSYAQQAAVGTEYEFEPTMMSTASPKISSRLHPPTSPTLEEDNSATSDVENNMDVVVEEIDNVSKEKKEKEDMDMEDASSSDESSTLSSTLADKCKESISAGITIQYYDPISVAGDPNALRTARVTRVVEDKDFPLVLSTPDLIPSWQVVKVQSKWRPLSRYNFNIGGTGGHADAIMDWAGQISDNHNQRVAVLAEENALIGMPGDMIRELHGGNRGGPCRQHINDTPEIQVGGKEIAQDVPAKETLSMASLNVPDAKENDGISASVSSAMDEKVANTTNVAGCPSPGTIIYAGAEFQNFQHLFAGVEEEFRMSGVNRSSLARKSKAHFSPEESLSLFGQETYPDGTRNCQFPKRGFFYCTQTNDCPFHVQYSHLPSKKTGSANTIKVYTVKAESEGKNPRPLCLTHNHGTNTMQVDGWMEVKHIKDMTQEEIDYVNTASTLRTKMPTLKTGLSTMFPGRIFDSAMLHRVIQQERKNRLGPCHERLPELIKLGELAKANGGAFQTELCPQTFTLEGTKYQTPRMREYALQYGSYHTSIDGTYGCNKYGLTVMPFIVPDCLGLMHCAGFMTSLSENSKDVVAAGELFMLSSNDINSNVSMLLLLYYIKLYVWY